MNTLTPRRRPLALAASAALALTMVGCGTGSGTTATPGGSASGDTSGVTIAGVTFQKDSTLAALVPDKVAKSGKLTAIQFDNSPADTFLDKNNRLAGWGPDLARATASLLGLQFAADVSGAFDTFIPSIDNGRYDTSWASIIVTPDRLKTVDIVAVHQSTTGVITKEGAGIKIAKPEDLCGLRVGALAGSAFLNQIDEIVVTCKQAGLKALTVDSFPQQAAAQLAVSSDRIDAFMTAKGQLTWLLSDGGIKGFEIQPLDYQPNLEGIAVGKNSGMTPVLTAALNKMIKDGSYAKILYNYHVTFGHVDQAVANPAVAK